MSPAADRRRGTVAEAGGAADRAPAWQRLAAELAEFATAWPRLTAPGAGSGELAERLGRLSSLVTELALADLAGTELATILGHYGSAAGDAGGADLGRACLRLVQASARLVEREAVLFRDGMARFARLASAAAHRQPARLLGLFIETQDAVRGEALRRRDHVACHAEVLNAALDVEAALRAGTEAVAQRLCAVSRAEYEQLAARVAALESDFAATASAPAGTVGVTAPAKAARRRSGTPAPAARARKPAAKPLAKRAASPTATKIKTGLRAATAPRGKPSVAKTARNSEKRPATSPRRRP